uniref:Metanogen output domain-containing protein n=1 Tax=Candidatus Methanogaster sp. ANME-2c ERB4 TaxID=2759911 RepID=A0A7G9YLZ5_9EURY|nr:hypothetical protein KNGNHFEO_00026 [Methanosarcinales archaeon ANME-2c ERB4]
MNNKIEYLHRTFMGLGAAIGELFGRSSQEQTNLFSSYIGIEIGKLLLDRGVVTRDTPVKELIGIIADELEFGGEYEIVEDDGLVTLAIKECNICPKKIGGHAFETTVCPVPGIIRGAIDVVKGTSGEGYAKLKPGVECEVTECELTKGVKS